MQGTQQDASGLPHTRSGIGHWLGTAAALAAVTGGALAVAPANGAVPVADSAAPTPTSPATGTPAPTPTPSGTPHALPAAAAPDPKKAALPLDCAGLPVKITQSFAADLRGDGTPATVVTAHCDAGSGTPPDGVFILHKGLGGTPSVAYTLVKPSEELTVLSITLRSDGVLQAVAEGYSSATVPRCCPDRHEDLVWTPHGSGYTRTVTLPGSSV